MPKREDIKKIMIIGSGPIVIGQACEFDYSGTQACKALRSLGYEIVLVNSNPATIMTDPDTADVVYIEPLNLKRMEEIIEKERPCALLPNLGGQSGLNLSRELDVAGVLKKYGVKIIGVQLEAIERGEDRIEFKKEMNKLNIGMAESEVAYTVEEAESIAEKLGYPVVLRPAYTMGGTGGGIVYNPEELRTVATRGIQASIVGQVLVEESIIGWEELEVEVVRDANNKMIAICFIENIDPMGVHTGDSFCVAPFLTISKELEERLKDCAFRIVESIQVIGGTNVQFAYDPKTDRICVIEINPRTSRSSALASKATGFPIAYVSALLATGLTLDEIPYYKCGTLDKYTPASDYVVVKFPRFTFDKFKDASDKLSTQMKAVGEAMSVGRTYKEALQKAVRSLEISRSGLGYIPKLESKSAEELLTMLAEPSSDRQFIIYEAIKKGASLEDIQKLTHIKRWYLEQMSEIAALEAKIAKHTAQSIPAELLKNAKLDGFSDLYLSNMLNTDEGEIQNRRKSINLTQTWEKIFVSGIAKESAYYYSTYHISPEIACGKEKDTCKEEKKVMVLGGGPNRIGQGIEFDYCCVHAAFALRDMGFKTIMVNCNPETVSTDYDTSDKLYFEPLTVEDVLSIYEHEKPLGVIAQFGGQTPLNIAAKLEKFGVNILGTSTKSIDLAEDRDLFGTMMKKLNIPMPESGMAATTEKAKEIAAQIGYPVMVRPSYVLGGKGMEIVFGEDEIVNYMNLAVGVTPERPILIDRFLQNAMECEADAICDGENGFVPAVMEHIELAGIHSGDSACIIPSVNIPKEQFDIIREYTVKIAKELGVRGLMNIQYAIEKNKIYVLEANPRASRTVPLVSKVCDIQMAKIATNIIMQDYINTQNPGNSESIVKSLKNKDIPYYGVKEAVFPFNMFPEVDPRLGPEMLSTGEVLGISESFGIAFIKSQEAAQSYLPISGNVFISVNDNDKQEATELAKTFECIGFKIYATQGTYNFFRENGIKNLMFVKKLSEGNPNILDELDNKNINIVVNTPAGKQSQDDDSYIRKACVRYKIPYLTTLAAAKAAVIGISEVIDNKINTVNSIQAYHKMLK